MLLLPKPPVTPLLLSHPPPEGDKVLVEKSSSYLPVALWGSHVLWVVALLFPCPQPLPDHSHSSFLMEVVWRPRIASGKKTPLLLLSPLLLLLLLCSLFIESRLRIIYLCNPPPSLFLPLFPQFEGAVRGHPLFSPSWVCWHTVNLRLPFTSATTLFNSLPTPHCSTLPSAFPEQ